MKKNYLDAQGRVLFVSDGICGGVSFATYYRKPNGSLKRLKSPFLSSRPTFTAAQSDLDLYAERKKLKEVAWNVTYAPNLAVASLSAKPASDTKARGRSRTSKDRLFAPRAKRGTSTDSGR